MDDWKLKTSPVVRLERPNKTFVCFVYFKRKCYLQCGANWHIASSVWSVNLQYQSEAAAYRLRLCNGGVYHRCAQFKHLQRQNVVF